MWEKDFSAALILGIYGTLPKYSARCRKYRMMKGLGGAIQRATSRLRW